jgi:hypothetical protein
MLFRKGFSDLAFTLWSKRRNFIGRDLITLVQDFILENEELNLERLLSSSESMALY